MLRNFLDLLNTTGFLNQDQTAEKLGISQPMVAQLMIQLIRLDYLEEVGQSCDSFPGIPVCQGCGNVPGCIFGGQKIWRLTKKGQDAIDKDKTKASL
jgi:hypothetical protein